eukprot:349859-Chlamydomonas_euryale.AAC.2
MFLDIANDYFDMLYGEFLYAAMEKMGASTGTCAAACVNGHTSATIEYQAGPCLVVLTHTGMRQGSPLSPALYLFAEARPGGCTLSRRSAPWPGKSTC